MTRTGAAATPSAANGRPAIPWWTSRMSVPTAVSASPASSPTASTSVLRTAPKLHLGHLDDEQRVALGIAQPEHRRDGVAHAADLSVDGDAVLRKVGVDRVDVGGVQRDAGLAVAALLAVRRRSERDGRLRALGRDLDPAVLAAEGDVDALLEAELLDVEGDRPVDVGDRDDDGSYLGDARAGLAHEEPPGFGDTPSTGRASGTHRST